MSTIDMFRLDGRTSIVTGGNRGIGRGISEALAEAGSDIVIANRDAEAGERAAAEIAEVTGVETTALSTDITDEEQVAALVEGTIERFGGVDILVNNAGITINTPAEEMSQEEWQRVIDINLTGAFYCAKHAARHMKGHGGGSIVNVSSISAFMANHPQPQVSYNASKAGLEGMKNQLASEWAQYDIRVNNVNPGYIRTEMVEDVLENDPEMAEIWQGEMLQEEIPTAEAIGPTVVYMASDAAFYMTGESVCVDGGYLVR